MVVTSVTYRHDLFNQTFGHEARREQPYSVEMHTLQQIFSVFVDEANARQIDHERGFVRRTALPALVQFIYTTATQFAFEKKPRRRFFVLCGNSNHVREGNPCKLLAVPLWK